MSTELDRLLFPSGRTVSALKKEAKRRTKEDSIPRHQALDNLAVEHGMNMPWADAMVMLKRAPTPSILSAYGPDIIRLRKAALSRFKESNQRSKTFLKECLIQEFKKAGYSNPQNTAKLGYVQLNKTVFHTVLCGNRLIYLYVGRRPTIDGFDKSNIDLFVGAALISEMPLTRNESRAHTASAIWGDVTRIELPENHGDDNGWWVCKYSATEPVFSLGNLTGSQVHELSNDLAISSSEVENLTKKARISGGATVPRKSYMDGIRHYPSVQNLVKWSKENPRVASGAHSGYAGHWGDWALSSK